MQLRLNGAFDRILRHQKLSSDPFALEQQVQLSLSKVVESCLSDLQLKLKTVILSSKIGASDLKRARDFIGKLTSRSALLDIEEILPKLIDYVKSAKMDHGLEKLRNSY